jgi:2'-5' RNA ligase
MRLFVALNLPESVRERMAAELLAPLSQRVPGVRWVRADTLHVTLAFLGERSEAEARDAEVVVRELADGRAAPVVSLRGLGTFPDLSRPRVVWLGIEDPSEVRALHRAFERERARLGLAAEGRAYHPHVTLGRVPPAAEGDVAGPLAEAIANDDFQATVALASLDLMCSELTPSGPRYSVLAAAPLVLPEVR